MGENEHFVILKKRPPESVNILKYIRQLASKVEQSIRVRVTYRVWPAVVQWGWLGVATVCYTFTCRTISPHVWSLQLRTLPPPPPVSLGHPPKLIDRQIVSNSFDNNRLENRTAESHFFPPEFESNEVETRIRIRASNDNALKWRVVSCHEMMSTLCESKKEKVACWLQLMTLSLDLCAHNNGILFTIICFFPYQNKRLLTLLLGVWLFAGLQAQRPYPDRYGPPPPHHHYPPHLHPHEPYEVDEYPACALVVPGLPGKSALMDRYHHPKWVNLFNLRSIMILTKMPPKLAWNTSRKRLASRTNPSTRLFTRPRANWSCPAPRARR